MLFFTFFALFSCFFFRFSYLLQPIPHSKCKGFATVAFTLRIYVSQFFVFYFIEMPPNTNIGNSICKYRMFVIHSIIQNYFIHMMCLQQLIEFSFLTDKPICLSVFLLPEIFLRDSWHFRCVRRGRKQRRKSFLRLSPKSCLNAMCEL